MLAPFIVQKKIFENITKEIFESRIQKSLKISQVPADCVYLHAAVKLYEKPPNDVYKSDKRKFLNPEL